jgi:hypothetical protein
MFLARYADRRDAQGRHVVVRNGSLPEREVHTGVGAVRVKVPRVRDRSGTGLRFHSALLPPLRTCRTATERRRHEAFDATHKRHAGEYGHLSLVVSALTPPRQRWCYPCSHTPRAPLPGDRPCRVVGPTHSPWRRLSRFAAWDLAMAHSVRPGDGGSGGDGGDRLHTPIPGAQLLASREHPFTLKPAVGRVWLL